MDGACTDFLFADCPQDDDSDSPLNNMDGGTWGTRDQAKTDIGLVTGAAEAGQGPRHHHRHQQHENLDKCHGELGMIKRMGVCGSHQNSTHCDLTAESFSVSESTHCTPGQSCSERQGRGQ